MGYARHSLSLSLSLSRRGCSESIGFQEEKRGTFLLRSFAASHRNLSPIYSSHPSRRCCRPSSFSLLFSSPGPLTSRLRSFLVRGDRERRRASRKTIEREREYRPCVSAVCIGRTDLGLYFPFPLFGAGRRCSGLTQVCERERERERERSNCRLFGV
jgi:hypothetical protein